MHVDVMLLTYVSIYCHTVELLRYYKNKVWLISFSVPFVVGVMVVQWQVVELMMKRSRL